MPGLKPQYIVEHLGLETTDRAVKALLRAGRPAEALALREAAAEASAALSEVVAALQPRSRDTEVPGPHRGGTEA